MIKGIGIDLTDKHRFEILIEKYGNKFASKLLSSKEFSEYDNSNNKASFLSKRFAAKEALSKAFGYGLYRHGIYPKQITIEHDSYGKPFFSFSKMILDNTVSKYKNIQLSLSDSDDQTIAFVTLE
tara:strand:+ start:548 stop:922 length:375 start_codon:yes stop_codon:yes gene_type:complete